MPRRQTPQRNEITHITIRCNNLEFLLKLERQFNSLISWMNCLPYFFEINIHHLVFMSNHIHLLLTPTHNNMGDGMKYLISNMSKYINGDLNRSNHIFGDRYAPTIITNEMHLINVIRYIYQNPVRAGTVRSPMEYPYSSLSMYTGTHNIGLVVQPDPLTASMFHSRQLQHVEWLNDICNIMNGDDARLLKAMLTKNKFKFTFRSLTTLSKRPTSLRI